MVTVKEENIDRPAIYHRGTWLLGNFGEFAADPLKMMRNLAANYAPITRFRLGPDTLFSVSSPEGVKRVMQTNYKNYIREERTAEAIRHIAGETLFTSSGDIWLKQRRLMQPAFHRKRIVRFGDEIVTETVAEMSTWPEMLRESKYLDLDKAMTRLTSQVIGRAMLSIDLRQDAGDLGDSFARVSRFTVDRIMSPVRIPLGFPNQNNRTFKQAVETIKAALGKILAERQAQAEDIEPAGDLLDMLLAARDEESGQGMDTAQLIAEMTSIVFAGHETTAATLAFAFALLMEHPKTMKAVQEEIDSVLGDRLPTLADLPALDLTNRVMLEALRMYPAASSTTRMVTEPDVICGVDIPAGSKVMVNIYGMHYHPDYWHDPDRFDPDRFLPENSVDRPKLAFLPFSTGPRKCIGDEFAKMESHLILATVLQRYTPQLKPGHVVKPIFDFVVKPQDGLPVTLVER